MHIVSPNPQRTQVKRFHPVAGPLSQDRYLHFVREELKAGRRVPLCVQVRHRGAVVCGRMQDAAPTTSKPVNFYKVVTGEFGTIWAAHTSVRMCGGGDGRCTCEPESRGDRAVSVARAGAPALPPLVTRG